jgi:hypothetical protein
MYLSTIPALHDLDMYIDDVPAVYFPQALTAVARHDEQLMTYWPYLAVASRPAALYPLYSSPIRPPHFTELAQSNKGGQRLLYVQFLDISGENDEEFVLIAKIRGMSGNIGLNISISISNSIFCSSIS